MEYLNNTLANGTRFHLDSPLNLLQSKITNVSRKHLLSMLTSCYQVDNIDPIDKQNDPYMFEAYQHAQQQQHEQCPPSIINEKNQMAYLINSDVIRHLDQTMSHQHNPSMTSRRRGLIFDDGTTKAGGEHKSRRCAFFNMSDKYLSTLYVIVKALYLLSAICQLVFLNRLIGNNFYILGLTLIKTFFKEIEWPHLDVFPVN